MINFFGFYLNFEFYFRFKHHKENLTGFIMCVMFHQENYSDHKFASIYQFSVNFQSPLFPLAIVSKPFLGETHGEF